MSIDEKIETSFTNLCTTGRKYIQDFQNHKDSCLYRIETVKATCRNYQIVKRFEDKTYTEKFPSGVELLEKNILNIIEQDMEEILETINKMEERCKKLLKSQDVIERIWYKNEEDICASKKFNTVFTLILMYAEDISRLTNIHLLQLKSSFDNVDYTKENPFDQYDEIILKSDKLIRNIEEKLCLTEGIVDA